MSPEHVTAGSPPMPVAHIQLIHLERISIRTPSRSIFPSSSNTRSCWNMGQRALDMYFVHLNQDNDLEISAAVLKNFINYGYSIDYRFVNFLPFEMNKFFFVSNKCKYVTKREI